MQVLWFEQLQYHTCCGWQQLTKKLFHCLWLAMELHIRKILFTAKCYAILKDLSKTLETTSTHATFHKLSQLCRIAFATNYFPAFFLSFCLWSHGDLRLGVLIEIRYKIIKRQLRWTCTSVHVSIFLHDNNEDNGNDNSNAINKYRTFNLIEKRIEPKARHTQVSEA